MDNALWLDLSYIYQHRKESLLPDGLIPWFENVFSFCAALKPDGFHLRLTETWLCCSSVFPFVANLKFTFLIFPSLDFLLLILTVLCSAVWRQELFFSGSGFIVSDKQMKQEPRWRGFLLMDFLKELECWRGLFVVQYSQIFLDPSYLRRSYPECSLEAEK